MYDLPISFKISAEAIQGVQENWTSTAEADPEQPVLMAIPEAFKGPGGALSPEELYGMAILNCFIATFKVISEASRFTFEKIDASMNLEVDKNETGKLWVARTHIDLTIHKPVDATKLPRLLEKASENCLVMASVNTAKTWAFTVVD